MSPVPGDLWMQNFFDEDPDDLPEVKESWVANAIVALGVTACLAMMIAFFVYEVKNAPDYDVLAPRVEKQLNDDYIEDVDVYVHTGRGQSFMVVVDGEQTGCRVWNTREMWDDPDLPADVRCLASEDWPFTPEPGDLPDQNGPKPSSEPTPSPPPAPTEDPSNGQLLEPFAELSN